MTIGKHSTPSTPTDTATLLCRQLLSMTCADLAPEPDTNHVSLRGLVEALFRHQLIFVRVCVTVMVATVVVTCVTPKAYESRMKILVQTGSRSAVVTPGYLACSRPHRRRLPSPVGRVDIQIAVPGLPSYVITNSAATLRTLHLGEDSRSTAIPSGIEISGLGRNATVVHDGTNTNLPQASERDARGTFRVGLIGRISPWKGQHVFLHAAAQVVKRFPKVKFFIVGAALFGKDQYEREVRQLARQLGLENAVEFTGFCMDVKRAIAELDVVVHASTKGEPFGQVIIEGMAACKPVVATNGGGVPEIVDDGITGILVPMGDGLAMADAICRICSDPVLARTMGSRGRQRVADHFTIEQTARRVESVYADVLG